jgi:hypothetical protein
MRLASAFLAFIALLTPVAAQNPPRTPAMSSLTLPASRLPEGCALAPSGTPFPTQTWPRSTVPNPWIGAERTRLAALRRVVEPWPFRVPDAFPPPEATQRAMALKAADGVAEGYRALYLESGNEIAVNAIRFEGPPEPLFPPRTVQFELGFIRASVAGPMGPCRKAIEAYLGAL